MADGRRVFVPGALPGERWRVGWLPAAATAQRRSPVSSRSPAPSRPAAISAAAAAAACSTSRPPTTPPSSASGSSTPSRARACRPTASARCASARPPAGAGCGSRSTRSAAGCWLGLRERSGHAVVPLEMCTVAHPALVALLAPLAEALAAWLTGPWPAEASLTLTDAGPDLLLHAARPPRAEERATAASLADEPRPRPHRLAVAAAPPEALITLRPPVVRLSGTPVELPPGAFLQATPFGEADACRRSGRLGRRCPGRGRPLRRRRHADLRPRRPRAPPARLRERAAAAARARAARPAGRNITVVERDLVRRPLQPAELDHDLVVLDPPRAGASAQCAALARSTVPRVIYASCHPESFARDARALVDAGFALRRSARSTSSCSAPRSSSSRSSPARPSAVAALDAAPLRCALRLRKSPLIGRPPAATYARPAAVPFV